MYRKIKNLTYLYLAVVLTHVYFCFYFVQTITNYTTLEDISMPFYLGFICLALFSIMSYRKYYFKLGIIFGLFCIVLLIIFFIVEYTGYKNLDSLEINYDLILTKFNLPIIKLDFVFIISQLLPLIFVVVVNLYCIPFIISNSEENEKLIRSKLISYSQKYNRMEVREISEKSNKNPKDIQKVIRNMIQNNELNAKYFPNTDVVMFNKFTTNELN